MAPAQPEPSPWIRDRDCVSLGHGTFIPELAASGQALPKGFMLNPVLEWPRYPALAISAGCGCEAGAGVALSPHPKCGIWSLIQDHSTFKLSKAAFPPSLSCFYAF